MTRSASELPLATLGVDHPERMTTDVADREIVRRRLPPSSGEPARAPSGRGEAETAT